MIARAVNGFTTRLYRRDGQQIGVLSIATWLGAPRNGRLRGREDDVARIELGGSSYRLEWDILDDPAGRGVRWWLMDSGHALASARACDGRRRQRWDVHAGDERYALVFRSRWLRLRADLLRDGVRVGGVSETTRMFALARTYEVTGPSALGAPVQAFLLHLATRTTR